jgi:hypothetical protein
VPKKRTKTKHLPSHTTPVKSKILTSLLLITAILLGHEITHFFESLKPVQTIREFAQAGSIIEEEDMYAQARSIPTLPKNIVPTVSLEVACSFDEENPRERVVSFKYDNTTNYRIDLTSSILSLDFLDIPPYHQSNSFYENELVSNAIIIDHNHALSSQYISLSENGLENEFITEDEYYQLTPEDKSNWEPFENKGSIDYLLPGQHTGMTISLPTDYTLRWEIMYTFDPIETDENTITDDNTITLTAVSAYNGIDCTNTVTDYQIYVPELIPHSIENPAGFYARTVNTNECQIDTVIDDLLSYSYLDIDPELIYSLELNNQTLLTDRTGKKYPLEEVINDTSEPLKPGSYVVVLQSYDEHGIKHKTQIPEAFYLEFLDESNNPLLTTNSIKDLWDTEESIVQIVNTDFVITEEDLESITHVRARATDTWEDHELFPNGEPNRQFLTSIKTTCFALAGLDDTKANLTPPQEVRGTKTWLSSPAGFVTNN